MKIFGKKLLEDFAAVHTDSVSALDKWVAAVQAAQWRTPHDIKASFRSADFLANNRVIFNIKGNHYRLVVRVRFQAGKVYVEWVGTHAQYDRLKL